MPYSLSPCLFFLGIVLICGRIAFATPLFWYCPSDWGYYTNGSSYGSNLKQLVASLASNATISGGYYSNTVGVGTPDQINGIIMCYADANRTACSDCLKTAADDVANLLICEYSMTAATHYRECVLHYSNKNFFSFAERFQPECLQNSSDATDFLSSSSVESMISSLTTEASNSDQKYASNETTYKANQTLYALVQCTRDLTANECTNCVNNYTSVICSDRIGATIMGPNCYIRYELYYFDVVSYTPPSAVPPASTVTPPSPVTLPSPPPPSYVPKGNFYIAIASGSAAAVALLLSVIVVLLWWRRRMTRKNTEDNYGNQAGWVWKTEESQKDYPKIESRLFSFNDLKRITHDFKNIIGSGGFGKVYMGLLEDGDSVAVKMHSNSSSQGVKELFAEAEILTRVHHKHLVALIGYCIDKNCMALVYEYMQEGNLYDKLKDNEKPLAWKQRLQIAYESALGLEYLHKACDPPLVHRDVKTSNILLTASLKAKIADFGLSRAFNNDVSHISTRVVGTPGYLDPEYYLSNGQLTVKSDVFSFGVVILEIITGRPPITNDQEGGSLLQWVRQNLSGGDIESIVDYKMQGKYDINSIWKVTNLAFKCTEHKTSERPTMTEVTAELKESLDFEISTEEMQHETAEILLTDVSQESVLLSGMIASHQNMR